MPRKTQPLPCLIDFEASSLGHRSYPIEVAWSGEDGWIERALIDPSTVPEWTDWDASAVHEVHGITRDALVQQGENPRHVAERLNHHLGGRTVYSDGGYFDEFWLYRLFKAARSRPAFTLEHLFPMLGARIGEKALDQAILEARRLRPWKHRAALDVLFLQECCRQVAQVERPAPRRDEPEPTPELPPAVAAN